MEQTLHTGGQLYISIKGERIADYAWGEAHPGISMGTDTILPWLSAGKPLTAFVLARLEAEKLYQLDDWVSVFIPEFGILGKEAITIQHVLTHTGGFLSADRNLMNLHGKQALECVCQTPLEPDWIPGQKAGYHPHSGWIVLGEMIARLNRQPAPTVYQSRLFSPLEMKDCWMELSDYQFNKYGTRIGQFHNTFGGEVRPYPEDWIRGKIGQFQPGSSACGPINQLGKFYEHLLNHLDAEGTALIHGKAIRKWTQRQRIGLYDHTFQHKMDWGLGFMVNSNQYGVETVPYSFGRTSSDLVFGHSGSQSSCGFADPAHGLAVAWILNGMPGEHKHKRRAREINSAIYLDLGLPAS